MTAMGVQAAGLALQTVPVSGTDLTLLTIFVGIIALFCAVLLAVLLGAVIAVLRLKAKVSRQIEDAKRKAQPTIASLRTKVDPILADVTEVVADLKPKIRSVSDDVAELSHMVRAQAMDLDSTISEVTSKARSQVDRVNEMVSSTLNTTATVASNVEKGVKVPFRELAGLVNGVRAGFEVLTGRRRAPSTRGRYSGVPGGVEREVHRAAEQARADAEFRAAEGAVAARRASSPAGSRTSEVSGASAGPGEVTVFEGSRATANAALPGTTQTRRSVVEAGEEIVTGSATDSKPLPGGR